MQHLSAEYSVDLTLISAAEVDRYTNVQEYLFFSTQIPIDN